MGRKWFLDVQLYEIIIQYKTKQDGKLENVDYHQCKENQNGFPFNESRIRPYRSIRWSLNMSGLLWNEPSIDLTRIIEISLALEARQIGLISRVTLENVRIMTAE